MTDLELAVLKALQGRYGKVNAISRDQLEVDVAMWADRVERIDDRTIRQVIENLRRTHPTGALIISSPSWDGYWLAEDIEEIKNFVNRKRTTAAKMLQAARLQINLARNQFEVLDQEPQIRMFT